ncbi:MAG: MerC domain-containing protein [Pseudoxanthomonas sp.]
MHRPLSWFDLSAIGLSGLCLVHCLALPVLAAFLPLFASWSHAEWVHALFAAIAVPLTGAALWRAHLRRRLPWVLRVLALAGLCGLLAGALVARHETAVTVTGSLLLVSAHLWNWRRLHRGGAGPACPAGECGHG